MAEAGIICERERVELVGGRVVEMGPEGLDHARIVGVLTTRLPRLCPEPFQIRSQSTPPLGEHAYLEPDVFVIRLGADRWTWPTVGQVGQVVLLVEVAQTSARRDRTEKAARRLLRHQGATLRPMVTQVQDIAATQRRLTVDEVIAMAEAGIITRAERVELVDGRLVEMSPEGVDHARVVRLLTTRLARLFPEGVEVGSQSTLPLGEHSYLEPDVYVVRPTDPAWRWPTAAEVVLVIEVARTSARRDRTEKAALYAEWGAREYWVVDLNRRAVVMHTRPGPDGYGNITTVTGGEVVLPVIDAAIPVSELFPPS